MLVAVEPAEASTAGASYDPGPFRTPLGDARAERDAAVRDCDALSTIATNARVERDAALRERDDYVMRLRSVRNTLATVAASNDRLAAQVAMLEAQLAATESQREAAMTRVAAFGDMLAVAWPIVRDMFTQIYLRMEPLMRKVPCTVEGHPYHVTPCSRADQHRADCCGEGWVTKGERHNDGCSAA